MDFYFEFCKAQFLCYQGDPNWLGWLVLFAAIYLLLKTGFVQLVGEFLVVVMKLPYYFVIGIYKDFADDYREAFREAFISADPNAPREFSGSLVKLIVFLFKVFFFSVFALFRVLVVGSLCYYLYQWFVTGEFPDL